MALDVFVFTQTKDSSGTDGNDDTIDCGFVPKAVIIYSIANATSEAESDTHAQGSYGFSDGTNQRCIVWQEEDGSARVDTRSYFSNAETIINFSDGEATIDAQGRVTFSGNNVVVDWFVNDTRATHYHGIVFGGSDITGVQVGDLQSPTGTGNQSYAADADVRGITNNEGILFMLGNVNIALNTIKNDYAYNIGAAASPTSEFNFACSHNDNTATAQPQQAWSETLVTRTMGSGGADLETAELVNFIDSGGNGFTLNWITVNVNQFRFGWMLIKGGQWQTGNETVPTSSGTKKTTTSFLPKGVIFAGNRLTSVGVGVDADLQASVGFSDDMIESSGQYTVNDAAETMENGVASSTTKSLRVLTPTTTNPTIDAQADISAFESDGFTLNYASGDEGSSAWKFGWIVCGDDAGGGAALERTASQTLTHTDSVVQLGVYGRTASQTLVHTDAVVKLSALVRTAAQTLIHTDAAARILGKARTASQTLIHTDAVVKLSGLIRTASQALTHTDTTIRRGSTFQRTASQTTTHTDAAVALIVFLRAAAQTLIHTDSVLRGGSTFARTAAQTLIHTDAAVKISALMRTASQTLIHTDAAVAVKGAIGFLRTASQTLIHTDSVLRGGSTFARTAAQTLIHTDAAVKLSELLRTASQTLTHTDTAVQAIGRVRTAVQTLIHTDSAVKISGLVRTASQTLIHTDVASRVKGFLRTAVQTLIHTDVAVAVKETPTARFFRRRIRAYLSK